MKKTKKILLALAIAMTSGMLSASAQIYVHVRPILPIVVRTAPPSPRHIWINEEWHERDGRYEYNGGHWVAPPHDGDIYAPGHWEQSKRGHRWHEGSWKGGNKHQGPDHRR